MWDSDSSSLHFFYVFFGCIPSCHTLCHFCLHTGEHKSVRSWFDRVNARQSCQSAAQKVLQGKGLQGMKSYLQRQPAPQVNQPRDSQPSNSPSAEVFFSNLFDYNAFVVSLH